MTINELIQRLQECGDEKFRDTAKVRIIDNSGDVIDEDIDVFDVKDGVKSVDIHIPYWLSKLKPSPIDYDEDWDDDEDEYYYDDEDDDYYDGVDKEYTGLSDEETDESEENWWMDIPIWNQKIAW